MSLGTVVVVAVLLGLIPALIARSRGGPFGFFWFLGTVLFPVALIMAVAAKDGRRKCPFCAEPVRSEAVVCPHCQRDIAAAPAAGS